MKIDMDTEHNSGQMVPNMKDNGLKIKLREKGHSGMLKEMFIKVSLRMTKLTAMVYILM